MDPRRTTSAEWADVWLGLDVGSDISLANAMAREIIHSGLADMEFIHRATTGYEDYARCVEAYPLERAEKDTGVPASASSAFWPTSSRTRSRTTTDVPGP